MPQKTGNQHVLSHEQSEQVLQIFAQVQTFIVQHFVMSGELVNLAVNYTKAKSHNFHCLKKFLVSFTLLDNFRQYANTLSVECYLSNLVLTNNIVFQFSIEFIFPL